MTPIQIESIFKLNELTTLPRKDLHVSCAHQFYRCCWLRSPDHATPVGRGEGRWDLPIKEQHEITNKDHIRCSKRVLV